MRIFITGGNGFIGKNFVARCREQSDIELTFFNRGDSICNLPDILCGVDFVFHLAGVNRALESAEFISGNVDLTRFLCDAVNKEVEKSGRSLHLIFASSVHAGGSGDYGMTKQLAENLVLSTNPKVHKHIFRFPNIFGKWCKPNYNSVVATFCHNISRDLPIKIHDGSQRLTLAYIDDVVDRFMSIIGDEGPHPNIYGYEELQHTYDISVEELAHLLEKFKATRTSMSVERVGTSLIRALYATYISYLPPENFSYSIPIHADSRGSFVEMLKTVDSGQISYFTAKPGVTRGGHYHHTKTEKFLVVSGVAKFRFRNLQTSETAELITSGEEPKIVDTAPGWAHDITNIGDEPMVVMIWANEIFDKSNPDTYEFQV